MHAQRREEYQCQWPMHAIAAAAGGPGISDLFIPAAAAAAAALLFLLCFFFFFFGSFFVVDILRTRELQQPASYV